MWRSLAAARLRVNLPVRKCTDQRVRLLISPNKRSIRTMREEVAAM
jgi:hypothetical protein